MVNYSDPVLDRAFEALASPIRRGMLARLSQGWTSVTELAGPYNVSLPAISKHLRIMEEAGLIERQKHGRVHYCRLIPGPMRDAADWLNFYRQFWETQLGSLGNFLEQEEHRDESDV
jgi:DNA-binding transcriptional ArsR family regulator